MFNFLSLLFMVFFFSNFMFLKTPCVPPVRFCPSVRLSRRIVWRGAPYLNELGEGTEFFKKVCRPKKSTSLLISIQDAHSVAKTSLQVQVQLLMLVRIFRHLRIPRPALLRPLPPHPTSICRHWLMQFKMS